MNKGKRAWLLVGFLVAVSLYALSCARSSETENSGQAKATATTHARVLESGKLRIAYFVVPPYLSKSAATGELSGIFADFAVALGESLSLEIEWVEEASLATLSVGLNAGRYDMIAYPLWRSGARARHVAFSVPLFYTAVSTYVATGDTAFDGDLSGINSADVVVAAIDGEMAGVIAKADYPLARVDSKPQLVDYSQILLEVASGKARVTFYDRLLGNRYVRANPGKVREVPGVQPVRVFAECFVLPNDDFAFSSMINAAVLEIVENGGLARIFEAHGEDPDEYLMRAVPFARSQD